MKPARGAVSAAGGSSPSHTEGNDRRVKAAGSLLVLGGLVFILLNTVAEGVYPNYNVGSDVLSDLGALGTNTFLLWNGMLFLSGALLILAAYLLFYTENHFRSSAVGRRANYVGILYILPGIGAIIVSLFQENSALGAAGVHGFGAMVTFLFGGISAAYAFKLTKAPFRYFSVALGVLTLAFILVFVMSGASLEGLTERLVVYPFVLWAIAFGGYLTALSSNDSVAS